MPNGDSKPKVAVFDFCETLADFQTATAFVDFVRENCHRPSVRHRHTVYRLMVKLQIAKLLTIFTGYRLTAKHLKLKQLRGVPQEEIESLAARFYNERVEPHLIGAIMDRMHELQNAGYAVGLSSGGYDVYLKHFVAKYGLDFCQCSELQFKNGRCIGRMVGKDCMRGEKIRRLNAAFGTSPCGSIAFSDSESDLPLLQWAAQGVVVSRGSHQQWIEKYHFNEIIW